MANRLLLFLALCFFVFGAAFFGQILNYGKFKLIACDVGQGDGLLLVAPGGQQVLVDGGPGGKILDCLSKHMPFWDRKIEVVISTHGQQDHLAGLLEAWKRYKFGLLVTSNIGEASGLNGQFKEQIEAQKIKVFVPKAGDRLAFGELEIEVLWPPYAKALEWQAAPPKDLNAAALVLRVKWRSACAYLTSDVNAQVLEQVVNKHCDILKVAHHGSKTGTSDKLLEQIKPKTAIIQVGKNNRYGHPTREVLDLLEKHGVKVLRNDLEGEIVWKISEDWH